MVLAYTHEEQRIGYEGVGTVAGHVFRRRVRGDPRGHRGEAVEDQGTGRVAQDARKNGAAQEGLVRESEICRQLCFSRELQHKLHGAITAKESFLSFRACTSRYHGRCIEPKATQHGSYPLLFPVTIPLRYPVSPASLLQIASTSTLCMLSLTPLSPSSYTVD